MRETRDDLRRLRTLLDRSVENAGGFLRSSFRMPECSLSAAQLTRRLRGLGTVALATVTKNCEPRVAPIGSLFFRGRFDVPSVGTAARTRHLRRRPSVSLTLYEGNDLATIAHGHAESRVPTTPTLRRWKDSLAIPAGRACSTGATASICGSRPRSSLPSPATRNVSRGKT